MTIVRKTAQTLLAIAIVVAVLWYAGQLAGEVSDFRWTDVIEGLRMLAKDD